MSGEVLNVIVANPVMIDAYVSGIPGNGKPFPDGAKTAKIQYIPKKSAEAPSNVAILDKLRNVAFMMKDSKRFANSGGWGYGVFNYDSASDKFTPDGTGATSGVGCHTIVKRRTTSSRRTRRGDTKAEYNSKSAQTIAPMAAGGRQGIRLTSR